MAKTFNEVFILKKSVIAVGAVVEKKRFEAQMQKEMERFSKEKIKLKD